MANRKAIRVARPAGPMTVRLALPIASIAWARRSCQVPPGHHLAMNKEVVVENGRRVGHQERLFRRLRGRRGRDLLNQEIILGKNEQGTARGLAPFIADELTVGANLQV